MDNWNTPNTDPNFENQNPQPQEPQPPQPPEQPYQPAPQPAPPTYYTNPGMNAYPTPPVRQKKNNGLAIASMILGIVSLVGSCCIWYLTIPCAVVGLILGIIALKNGKDGMAIAGIVMSAIGLAIALLVVIFVVIYGTDMMEMIESSLQSGGYYDGYHFR